MATEAPTKKWGENMGPREDFQAFILISILLLNTITGNIVVKYLFAEYEGEDDSILPPSVRKQAEDVEEALRNILPLPDTQANMRARGYTAAHAKCTC